MARRSAASEASTSPSRPSSERPARGSASSTRSAGRSSRSTGPTCSDTTTCSSCTPATPGLFFHPTCCAEGSPARTSAPPASASGSRPAPAQACGASSPGWPPNFGPTWWCSRTPPACSDGASIESYATLPRSGSMLSGRLFERPTSGLHTGASDCSLWPTPTAVAHGSSQNGTNSSRPSTGTPSLHTRARSWATPTTRDANSAARGTTTTGAMHAGESLTDQMRGHHGLETTTAGAGGLVLSPGFVEALMGLPDGWTDVPAEPRSPGSGPSATPSSPPKRRSPSGS